MIRSECAFACLVLVTLAACKRDDAPRRDPPQPAPAPPAAVYAVNKAHDVLAAHGVRTTGMKPGAWAGHWVGKLEMFDPMTGYADTDMTVTQDAKGIVRGVQSAMGVTVTLVLAPSPDQPGLAANIQGERQTLPNGVSFAYHHELAAVLSGDELSIADYTVTDDPGTYQGMKLPTTPPQTSMFKLHRVTP